MVDNVEPLAAKTGNTETLWSLVDHVAPLEVETGNTDKWWTLDSATFLCMATSLKSWALQEIYAFKACRLKNYDF